MNKIMTIDAHSTSESVGTGRAKLTITFNVDNASLFKSRFSNDKDIHRILINGEWFFISEETYNQCLGMMQNLNRE